MRQLARTLLILGGVTACERAHPVGDDVRPATPLVDPGGVPAVGNIGQTGAPAAAPPSPSAFRARAPSSLASSSSSPPAPSSTLASSPSRRAERVLRAQRAARTTAAHAPAAIAAAGAVAPAAGAIAPHATAPDAVAPVMPSRPVLPPRVPPRAQPPSPLAPSGPTLSIQTGRPEVAASPLLDRRERPAVANMGRLARMSTPREQLAEEAGYIASIDRRLPLVTDEYERQQLVARRAKHLATYQQLAHDIAQAEQAREAP